MRSFVFLCNSYTLHFIAISKYLFIIDGSGWKLPRVEKANLGMLMATESRPTNWHSIEPRHFLLALLVPRQESFH